MYWHHVQKYLEQEQQQKSFVTSGWESGKAKLSVETCHNDPCCCQHQRFSCQNRLFQSEDTTWKCSDAKELKHLRNLMNEFLSKNMNIYWLFLAGFPCQTDLALVELMWPPVLGYFKYKYLLKLRLVTNTSQMNKWLLNKLLVKFWEYCKYFWKGRSWCYHSSKDLGNRIYCSKPHSNDGDNFFLAVLEWWGTLRHEALGLMCSQCSVNVTLCLVYSLRIPRDKWQILS